MVALSWVAVWPALIAYLIVGAIGCVLPINVRRWLASKLNSSQIILVLPPKSDEESEEDLRRQLTQQPISGWLAIFASQCTIGAALSLILLSKIWLQQHVTVLKDRYYSAAAPLGLILDLLFLFAGFAMWRKRRFGLRIARLGLFVSIVFSVLGPLLLIWIGFSVKEPRSRCSILRRIRLCIATHTRHVERHCHFFFGAYWLMLAGWSILGNLGECD